MSFQGDVAGIGLGELLQGLSRGGRDGVLTLYGDKLSSTLGLHAGQMFLLPGPDEDADTWRERSLAAYADKPEPALEAARRQKIARAARLESMYLMLEAPNLHFRFEPGPIPLPDGHTPAAAPDGMISLDGLERAPAQGDSPWGPGITVEYMLLEHARIFDEGSSGVAATLSSYDMPRALDSAREGQPEVRDFLEQCDGKSTLQEISDRLGWPMTQCRNTVGGHIEAGNLRIAQDRELLASSQRELELGRIARAASRLTGWVFAAPPGPPSVGDADLLVSEWESGRLGHILHALEPSVGRSLLRKLDRVHLDAHAARLRWRTLYEAHKKDEISLLHEIALRLVATEEPDARTFSDLLRLARAFQDRGKPRRTRTLLRLASGHLPARPKTRIELGKRMLETGLVEEGTRWLLNTAHDMIAEGDPEMALAPIRAVLREIPDHGEAGSLQIHARTLLAKQKKRKVNVAIGASLAVFAALAAFVQFRAIKKVHFWEAEVQNLIDKPDQALALLDDAFGPDPPERIIELRAQFSTLRVQQERRDYDAWNEDYAEAEDACRFGDPLLGLRRALELLPPPGSDPNEKTFAHRQDLLGVVAARLGERASELDLPATAPLEELNQEQRLVDLLEEILALIDPDASPADVTSFHFRMNELREEVLARRVLRAKEREVLSAEEENKQADILLATARAHATAGDLARALTAYDRLLSFDETLGTIPKLQTEIDFVRRHATAVDQANELADAGDHQAAAEVLREVCPRPLEHLLPYRVESRPSGVRVTLPGGNVRTTPFVAKSGVGEVIDMSFTAPGFKERVIRLDRPTNLRIFMYKLPERIWSSQYRVEAVPVPAGDDHILADRRGNVRRLNAKSEAKWERSLSTLGGIARTPIFLPERPGHLLIVAEDGQTWLINAANGSVQGPRDIGSPPVDGPVLTRSGATVSFADGRVGVWTDSLEPLFYQNESMMPTRGPEDESTGSRVVMLRRGVDKGKSLESPWNGWKVVVREEDYRILDPEGRGVTIERDGDWEFTAWESPKAGLAHGRIWVSDEGGVRSYAPSPDELVLYGPDE